jgi:hypothetical protein
LPGPQWHDFLDGCVLHGYNAKRFDVPLLRCVWLRGLPLLPALSNGVAQTLTTASCAPGRVSHSPACPLRSAEFARAGIQGFPHVGVPVVDSCRIFFSKAR